MATTFTKLYQGFISEDKIPVRHKEQAIEYAKYLESLNEK